MADRPQISVGGWITIGGKEVHKVKIDAIVCTIFDNEVEVVYLDDRKRAINSYIIWTGTHWEFKKEGPSGNGYADNYDRLKEYVSKLRRGRYKWERMI